jgi:protein arginine kinase
MLEEGPVNAVAISSRARLARNLPHMPFAPRANVQQLQFVAAKIDLAFAQQEMLARLECHEVAALAVKERCFLRESHLISTELEKGEAHRIVFLAPEMNASIMVNEEDHLRLATLVSGFRAREAYNRLCRFEARIEAELELAYSSEFGYLTACPTNTGTGLRISVMAHLPGIVLAGQTENILSPLGHYGLTVRGAHGENSENAGDLFQISNELTLGKSEMQIIELLETVAGKVIEQELHIRATLLQEAADRIEDRVCRAMGQLATARRMDTAEAVTLLSCLRLGIGQSWGPRLSHPALSRLFLDIQPGHLQCRSAADLTAPERDQMRAAILRGIFMPMLRDGHRP